MSDDAPLDATVGIVGSGMLGGAIARAWLEYGAVAPERLRLANRRGSAEGFEAWPVVSATADLDDFAEACDVILLAVPPAAVPDLALSAEGALVMSVMAGVSASRIVEVTGASRVIRAMSNPAAEKRLAYSPWWPSPGVTQADRTVARTLFGACGAEDEAPEESQIELFTAMTGPSPGFVARFAAAMARWAETRGVEPDMADRAVRQLFLSAGGMMAESEMNPQAHVRQMIDYAGTTAAGVEAMDAAGLDDVVARGLDAAVERTRSIAG